MKLVGVDDYDIFGDEVIFWIVVSDMPQSIQDKAKQIDKEEYNPDCFGMCVFMDTKTAKIELSPDRENTNVYYVDNNGDKAWFWVEIAEDFLTKAFTACKKKLDEKRGAL